MRPIRVLKNRTGMALVLTILIVALLTITVFDFFYNSWIQAALATSYRNETRAFFAARSGQEAAKLILVEDARSPIKRDALTEEWAQSTIPLPIDDEYSFFAIRDESGKVNLNKLTTDGGYQDDKWVEFFVRLLDRLELDTDLAGAVVDWTDKNSQITLGGAEDGHYLSLKKPYHPKNSRLDSINELRLVKGFTPEIMHKLQPHISLWGEGPININTATPHVLLALDDEMTSDLVKTIMTARIIKPFDKREDIKQIAGIEDIYPNIALLIDVKSDYYSVESNATFGDSSKSIRAVYKRSTGKTDTLYYKTF